MYIGDKLVDQTILSSRAMHDETTQHNYIQGAINNMLEKWSDLIEDQDLKPRFYIKAMHWG